MSRFVTVARYVASAVVAGILAMLSAPKMVWEAGKWVLRAVSPQPQAPQAQGALMQQVEELVAETESQAAVVASKAARDAAGITSADVGPDFHRHLGQAALQFLMPEAGVDPTLEAMIDDEKAHYLLSLPRDQLALFVCMKAEVIGRHLSGDAPLATMPRIPTFREYQATQYARLVKAGHSPDPRDFQHVVRKADVPDAVEEEDAVRYGMR